MQTLLERVQRIDLHCGVSGVGYVVGIVCVETWLVGWRGGGGVRSKNGRGRGRGRVIYARIGQSGSRGSCVHAFSYGCLLVSLSNAEDLIECLRVYTRTCAHSCVHTSCNLSVWKTWDTYPKLYGRNPVRPSLISMKDATKTNPDTETGMLAPNHLAADPRLAKGVPEGGELELDPVLEVCVFPSLGEWWVWWDVMSAYDTGVFLRFYFLPTMKVLRVLVVLALCDENLSLARGVHV